MRQHIANFVTLSNLFFGCCAVLYLLNGQPHTAAWCILGAFLCDYADGMIARALGVASPLGRELDSLADAVSFGVAPGAMLYSLLAQVYCSGRAATPLFEAPLFQGIPLPVCTAALPAFILSMFSALRLAKFNLDTRQKNYFIGLSTPGCTLFVLGLTLAAADNQFGIGALLWEQPWIIYGLVVLLSFLLVSEIPMYGLKIRSMRWKGNEMPFFFIFLSASALYFLRGAGLSSLIIFYVLLSIVSRQKIQAVDTQ